MVLKSDACAFPGTIQALAEDVERPAVTIRFSGRSKSGQTEGSAQNMRNNGRNFCADSAPAALPG
jgi:hypothetical protein